MSAIRKLAGQTVVYGLSSIIGRFLNFLLVPLHTRVYNPEEFGVITEMYAYVAFLIVLLNYGLETAFFRFASKHRDRLGYVYGSAVKVLSFTTTLFILGAIIWAQPLADLLRYPEHREFVIWFAVIVGFDALTSIPMARLRLEGKAMRFALVNLITVGVNIALNLLLIALPAFAPEHSMAAFINPAIGVGYVFIANLVASAARLLMLLPYLLKDLKYFDAALLRQMLGYGLPLILVGLAGIVNETLDRILIKYLLFDRIGEQATMAQLGIYGACYKLAIILQLFIQAFRYAAEPFFFDQQKERNAPGTYARLMHYFVIFCTTILLMVLLFLDVFKYFIPNEQFWVGLHIVPILLMAYVFMGVYYNLSVWYKLSDHTGKGALVSVAGAVITVVFNLLLIPRLGYEGAAWTTLICYFSMCVISWLWGRRHYPVPYRFLPLYLYMALALGLYFISQTWQQLPGNTHLLLNGALFLLFAFLVWYREIRGKNVFSRHGTG